MSHPSISYALSQDPVGKTIRLAAICWFLAHTENTLCLSSISFSIDTFNLSIFPFTNCSLVWCNHFAQVLCFFVPMQSSFTVHEMDSASEPPSPMAAAASDKRKFRTCLHCTSRMPSIDFDTHTLCIGCRHQVCDLTVHCDECRDWSDTKRSAFVKYNRTLKAKRDYKDRRRARLSGAAQSPSDQSVYDTDTEVPSLDEPLPSVQVQSDFVECVVSQECVVSEAPSTEAGPSDILYVTSGDRFE